MLCECHTVNTHTDSNYPALIIRNPFGVSPKMLGIALKCGPGDCQRFALIFEDFFKCKTLSRSPRSQRQFTTLTLFGILMRFFLHIIRGLSPLTVWSYSWASYDELDNLKLFIKFMHISNVLEGKNFKRLNRIRSTQTISRRRCDSSGHCGLPDRHFKDRFCEKQ